MMKSAAILCLFLASILIGSPSLAQKKKSVPNKETQTTKQKDVEFIKDFDDAVRQAHVTGKPIFVYVFDSV